MKNNKLKELLAYLEGGDPIKDFADEGELVVELAEDLYKSRQEESRLRKIVKTYDLVINSLPKDQLVHFANLIPGKFNSI